MATYNEDLAKKELDNLFNELFVVDLKKTINENHEKSKTLYANIKLELREVIQDELVKKVETTIQGIKESYDKALSTAIGNEQEIKKQLDYNMELLKTYDEKIISSLGDANTNITKTCETLSGAFKDISQDLSLTAKRLRLTLNLVLLISIISLVISVISIVSG